MKTCNFSFARVLLPCMISLVILVPVMAVLPSSVFASTGQTAANESKINPAFPRDEPTPTPQPEEAISFNPDSVSITLIFESIFKWLFGKDLVQIFNEVELTEEQKEQIALLTGETNPINLVKNFCDQVRSGDFSRMAESVRESNHDDGSGAPSPAILMDFFEQLGAFCPAR